MTTNALCGSEAAARPIALESAWDEYLLWLSFAVPGMLHRANVDAMAHALRHLPPNSAMLEIGTFCGLSACVLCHLRERLDLRTPFYTVDRWEFEGQEMGAPLGESKTVTHDAYREFVRASYLRNATTFCGADLPRTIETDSAGFFAAWRRGDAVIDVFGRASKLGGPIGFAYIDGNHTFEGAHSDFAAVNESLVSGGHILFDDSGDGGRWEGVGRAVRAALETGEYEVVAKTPNYLLRRLLRKRATPHA